VRDQNTSAVIVLFPPYTLSFSRHTLNFNVSHRTQVSTSTIQTRIATLADRGVIAPLFDAYRQFRRQDSDLASCRHRPPNSTTRLHMTITESSPDRRGIATRALIVLALLCFVVGIGMIYIGSTDSELLREQRRTEMLKVKGLDSSDFRECLRAATLADDGVQVTLCYPIHGPDHDYVQTLQDGLNAAERLVSRGLALIFLPLPLLLASLIARWVITSRWTRSASLNTQSKQRSNAA